jgi:hypothetical protein
MLDGWKANFWEKNMVSTHELFLEFEYSVVPQPSPSWKSAKFKLSFFMYKTIQNFLLKISFTTM